MTEYTIVEPHVEFFEPPNEDNYLEFLERCTRTCYKSEDKIKPGSAEKLMSKVVKEYKHLSVTEHCNTILRIRWQGDPDWLIQTIVQANPLFGGRYSITHEDRDDLITISGNIRMWVELFERTSVRSEAIWGSMECALNAVMPFFFKENRGRHNRIEVIDSNPITNKDNLSIAEMKKHMTATFKLTGDRTMSHQLVRHRLFAFSQESQRYCNYGKKGFQFIVPPSVQEVEHVYDYFVEHAVGAYEHYVVMLEKGVKPEDARGLLPNCTKTEVVTTGTLGYWIDHIFPHRAHNPKAQWQIRMLMLQADGVIRERIPVVYGIK